MIFASEKRQQNNRLLSQLSESDTEYMIGQNSSENRSGDRANTVNEATTLFNTDYSIQGKGSQVNIHTLEDIVFNKIRCESNNVIASVEKRVQGSALTEIENLVIPRVELAVRSVNVSTGCGMDNAVLDPDQRDSSGTVESLQMTA